MMSSKVLADWLAVSANFCCWLSSDVVRSWSVNPIIPLNGVLISVAHICQKVWFGFARSNGLLSGFQNCLFGLFSFCYVLNHSLKDILFVQNHGGEQNFCFKIFILYPTAYAPIQLVGPILNAISICLRARVRLFTPLGWNSGETSAGWQVQNASLVSQPKSNT